MLVCRAACSPLMRLVLPALLPCAGHNNHHAAPHSASTWVWWYQVDCQYLVIRLFEALGLASNVVVAPPSKLRADYSSDGLALNVVTEWGCTLLCVAALSWAPTLCGCGAAVRSARALAEEAVYNEECSTEERASIKLGHVTHTHRAAAARRARSDGDAPLTCGWLPLLTTRRANRGSGTRATPA